MTSVCLVKKSLASYETTGIFNSVMPYSLQSKVQSNVKLYFYRFDADDLVEVLYRNDIITIIYFSDNGEKVREIKENSDLQSNLVAYIKAANLENKSFLFDVDLRLAVNYSDFQFRETIPEISSQAVAFILDKKPDGYVIGNGSVYIFIKSVYSPEIDGAILCFFNNAIGVNTPTTRRLAGCESSMIISALFSGAEFDKIISDIEKVDSFKFINTINKLEFNPKFLHNKLKTLKTEKVKKMMLSPTILAPPINDEKVFVPLSFLMQIGLDSFLESVSDDKVIRIDIDAEPQTVRSAYIENGMLYICPVAMRDITYFKDIFDSDNVALIFN